MSEMSMPGFTAQSVFPASNGHNIVVGAIPNKNAPGLLGCLADCADLPKAKREACQERCQHSDIGYTREQMESGSDCPWWCGPFVAGCSAVCIAVAPEAWPACILGCLMGAGAAGCDVCVGATSSNLEIIGPGYSSGTDPNHHPPGWV